ncbi:heavy-metal-associated domain-containing protein [Liquorilactobacillus mali]|nr:heavy metal-associated domain-containing protein [Liquorilactobacillus mali]EJF00554.1 copper chaperone [Liquorilactobacillus mali KCTC 3596 = DSM 20444]MDC7953039.1 heavy-metal-associated domain-containing protein [Liquorilactobacillus mali]MDN7146062.1 heavy metal-associated domain-containing protein [Liquorilactobacillus mali]MDV7757884.1 carbonate dehydratase [Liquorilactobacillus mali]QFQ74041.1 heavy-metal-associated domain-containing protein [Liquorilactobacillus mali]
MEKTYDITGMKCSGCVKKVTEAFTGVSGVTKVAVSLADGNAVVAGDFDEQNLKTSLKGTHYNIKL